MFELCVHMNAVEWLPNECQVYGSVKINETCNNFKITVFKFTKI